MSENRNNNDADETRPSDKVARLLVRYNLGDAFGARLEALWTGKTEERMSLRDLADLFNRRLLERGVTASDMSTADGEVDNLYRLLAANDASTGVRLEHTLVSSETASTSTSLSVTLSRIRRLARVSKTTERPSTRERMTPTELRT